MLVVEEAPVQPLRVPVSNSAFGPPWAVAAHDIGKRPPQDRADCASALVGQRQHQNALAR